MHWNSELIDIPSLGISVNPLTAVEIVDIIESSIDSGEGIWIGNHNLHSAYLCLNDADFKRIYELTGLRVIDGWPILRLASRAAKTRLDSRLRVGSSDWLSELLARRRSMNILAIGGTAESSRLAYQHVAATYPEITWISYEGFSYLRTDSHDVEITSLTDAIKLADLVLVGLGMPQQERWIGQHYPLLSDRVVANVGGCLDYLAGTQALAPRWLGVIGLEWAFRLVRSPRRLFHRYLVEPVLLARIVAGSRILGTRPRRGH